MVTIERYYYKKDFCQHKPVKLRISLFSFVRVAGKIVTRKEVVWIHGPFLKNLENMLKIGRSSLIEGTILLKQL